MKRSWSIGGGLFALGILVLLMALPAAAHDRDDRYDHEGLPIDRFNMRMGGFLVGRYDTTARFDSRQIPVGTLIDLEDNFNVDSTENVLRIDGFYRFNNRHRIDWTWYTSRRDGEATAIREVEIGDPDDPDGGFVIPKDAQVNTVWNFDLYKVGYAWSIVNKSDYEMYIGAGLNMRKFNVDLSYSATLGDIAESDQLDVRQWIPLPTLKVGGRWNFAGRWQTNFSYELFMLDLGDYRGSQQDVLFSLEHNTFRYLGFGAGFNLINVNLRAKSDDYRGEFDSRITGLLVYLKAKF